MRKNVCARREDHLAHRPYPSQNQRRLTFHKQQILEPYRTEIDHEQSQIDEAEAESDARRNIPVRNPRFFPHVFFLGLSCHAMPPRRTPQERKCILLVFLPVRPIRRAAIRSPRALHLRASLSELGRFPASPRDDAEVALRSTGQHGEQFQQVAVRIVEEERSSGHPGKNYGLVGGLAGEVEGNYVSFAKALGSLQQTVKI